jgi:hypothetical protein
MPTNGRSPSALPAPKSSELRSKDKFDGEDLLAMGKLCIFGQEYEPARAFLVSYIALPHPQSPEVGHLLLARAFIGLGAVPSAESEIQTLLSLFPYDASIHLGIDMVIDAASASDATEDLDLIPRLEAQQLPHIFDAFAHGGSLSGNGDSVDAALLTRDALRCADALRRNFKPEDAAKILDQLKAALAAPSIVASASYPSIQAAMARYDLFRQSSPVREFHGAELTATGSSIPRAVPVYDTNPAAHRIVRHIDAKTTTIRILDDRTLVLLFSLGSPACSETIHGILDLLARDHVTPGLKVVAVTSFAANTGIDSSTPELLAALRAFRSGLPQKLPVLIVPDAQLKPFFVDMWPAAILFDGKGRVRWINSISGSSGSIRQTVRELEMPVPVDFPANSN